jgi:hypothetical protein
LPHLPADRDISCVPVNLRLELFLSISQNAFIAIILYTLYEIKDKYNLLIIRNIVTAGVRA